MTTPFFDQPLDVDSIEGLDRALAYIHEAPDMADEKRKWWTDLLLDKRNRLAAARV